MGRGPVFLGRERELAELASALEELSAGRGSLFLLVGEPGIGKTRLADEACDLAAARGFAVHWGRCWESGGAPAYWPWTEIVSALLGEGIPESKQRPTNGDAEALSAIVPALTADAAAASRVAALAGNDAEQARFRIFRAVAALLGQVSGRRPLVLVLDDLHAADQSSLLLLRFLARELRALRVLVIGAYRDVEARLSEERGQVLAQIGREARTLHLGRLASAEVASFIRSVAGDLPQATVASIFEVTHGNPLFLDEVVRTLVAKGDLAGVANPSDLTLPYGVREAIRQHLARLSDDDRPVVEVASVLGNEIRPRLLAAAAALPPAAVEAAVARAVTMGVLIERGRHRYGFGHGLICEALYRDLPNTRRMELHARVAEVLDRESGDRERPWAELAHHLLEAGPRFVERAVTCAIRAAEHALDAVAYDDALTILERARASLELVPALPRVRAELCLAESLARARTGETARGRALCLQAASLAKELGDSDLGVRIALGYGAEFAFGLVDPQLVALLEEALASLPPSDSPLRARAMARLAAALQPAHNPGEPIQAAREAVAMARRIGDKATLLAVLHAGIGAMMDFAHPDERLPLNAEVVRLADELRDRPKALRAHARLIFDHLERAEFDRADAHIEVHERLAAELRSGRSRWQARLFRGMRATMEGRFADAERLADEARAVGEQVGDRGGVEWTLLMYRFGVLRARDAHDELARLKPELSAFWNALHGVEDWRHAAEGAIHARVGQSDDAAESWRGAVGANLVARADAEGLGMLAEICASAGDQPGAADLYARILPRSEQLVSWGMTGFFCEGPFQRQLGLLAAALGRTDDAIRHFDAAAVRNRQLGLRPHLARVLYEHAAALSQLGRDPDNARTLAAEARALAGELKMAGLLGRIDALAIEHAVAEPPRPPAMPAGAAVPAFAMRREGDFWTLVSAEGSLHLKDTRGLQTLHRLVTNPDQEFHATDLASDADGVKDAGDAGELIDREARESYRSRLEDLSDARREAERFGDATRAARVQEEIDFLAGELSRAVGLGGRERRAGSAAERARVAVQKRIKEAIRRIEAGAPALARHLSMTVQTGSFCAYRPGGRFR